jgi:hypothetical protein
MKGRSSNLRDVIKAEGSERGDFRFIEARNL